MATKEWKKIIVDEWRTLWEKDGDWVHLDKSTENNEFIVGAHNKINPKTINGHFKFFKNKQVALEFIKLYMRTH